MSFRHLQNGIIVPYASRAFQARMHTAINFLMSLSGHPVDGGDFVYVHLQAKRLAENEFYWGHVEMSVHMHRYFGLTLKG